MFDEKFVPQVDSVTQEEIKSMFPGDFEQRKDQLIKAGFWRGDKVMIKFLFGNLHQLQEAPKLSVSDPSKTNKHRWTAYVALATDKD